MATCQICKEKISFLKNAYACPTHGVICKKCRDFSLDRLLFAGDRKCPKCGKTLKVV